jgi:hypothetical protein
MSDQKLNCWEFMQCGREPGGARVEELGICPAGVAEDHDGRNGGVNGGRYCWSIGGSFGSGGTQCVFAQKLGDCSRCHFFREVERQEGRQFVVYARGHQADSVD